MMSDEQESTKGPVDDALVTRNRHRCIVLGLLFIALCSIAAIVLPFALDYYDDDEDIEPPFVIVTPSPTTPPVAPPTPTLPPPPTESPSASPSETGPTNPPTSVRLGQFIRVFLVPISGEEVFEDPTSPQYKAAVFLAEVDNYGKTVSTTEELEDRYALTTFYYAMEGDNWFTCFEGDDACTTGNSWLDPDVNHCEWSAIRCNQAGRVVDLFFPTSEGNGLFGEIPPEFSVLSELQNFVAINNLISGSFPESFGNMTNLLRVILDTNFMNGSLPEGFLANSPIQILNLANNEFTGDIPASIGNSATMTQLILGNNEFSGTIPEDIANLELLGTLDLSNNDRLRGSIPTSIFGMVNLENLYLNGSANIQGILPGSISGLTSLGVLRLGGTGLTGTLPDELFTLNRLEELDLTGAGFSGPLSEDFELLAGSIRTLKLSNNAFSGPIPMAFDVLILLNTLELEGNELEGSISDELCSRRGDGIAQLNELTVDCPEVTCTCCTNAACES